VRRTLARAAFVVASLSAAACGPKRLTLPTDAGMPLADLQAVHDGVSRACRGARTLTAELALSGHALYMNDSLPMDMFAMGAYAGMTPGTFKQAWRQPHARAVRFVQDAGPSTRLTMAVWPFETTTKSV